MSIPAGTYPGQDQRIDTVGLWSLILVRKDMPDKMVYQLARALHQGESRMAKRLQQEAYTTSNNTVQHVARDMIHAGAWRYYQEAGLLGK